VAGKALGAMFGAIIGLAAESWLAAGLFAVMGLLVGHLIDRQLRPAEESGTPTPDPAGHPALLDALPAAKTREEVNAEARSRFADHVCTLFAAVARSDGEPVRDEVRVVREYFEETLRFSAAELELVRVALKRALDRPVGLDLALRACADALPAADRLMLLSALYDLALADGELKRSEREVLQRIVRGLDISAAEHQAVLAVHYPNQGAEYARLGLEASATDEEVKSAFRKLAALHHPDRVAHLGPGAMEVAARRFREIKDAYDAIRRIRGI
jgi:DnaJ like chaperone protein